jgi:hypothetical protein
MESRSTRLMLLGIAVILFSLAFRSIFNVAYVFKPLGSVRYLDAGCYAIFPLVGMALVLVGFFAKPRA